MIARAPVGCALAVFLSFPVAATAQAGVDLARLYGRVATEDGRMYEGFLRWGTNEAGWYDILHSNKRIPERNRRDAERLGWEPGERKNRIEIFGVGITLPGGRASISRSAQSGIRFGHLSSLERLGSSRARVVLRSGEELELHGGGDLGSSLGRISVEDARGGIVQLAWSDLRAVDFMPTPARASAMGERLWGTLITRDGDRFTGYVAWDIDEALTTDVLDGEAEGRDRKIPFSDIRVIARNSSRSARVLLESGEDVVLSGTNDVNDSNRDILVADPALGEVRVAWEELDRVEFSRPPGGAGLPAFDGGRRLRGTVETVRGERHAGLIRWDNDEEYTWEILDGELRRGIDLDIEFGAIASIERQGFRTSVVTLRDGRRFELGNSNDVDENNKGVYVERADSGLVLVPWDSFRRVSFDG
ncbi:MAG TPA: hypothetical protein VMM12_18795 [Longimicrobiales bacterium]|nr:hypothetical protein [Longimicrobiales bacterium]